MKILLINPNSSLTSKNNANNPLFNRIKGRFSIISAPLAFPMIAAVTPKHHFVTMLDENYQNIDYNVEYDIVGITTMTPGAPRAYEIADEFRKKNVTVVIGGTHATALPKEAKQHADSIVIGEGEETWPQLLTDFEKGKLKPFYYQTKPVDLNKIPPPRRDIINRSFIAAGVQTSRGCPFKCKYCFYSNSLYGSAYRKRPIEKIVEEIKNIPQKLIIFHDSSFTIDIDYTKNLFKALKGLNKKFICLGNVDVLSKDDELLNLAVKAGCIQWHVGFESLTPLVLDDVGKKTNKVENYLKAVEKIHDHGMNVHGFFMFGFDKESIPAFEETLQFLKNAKLDSADFSILVPYPGTKLYDELIKENRIETKDWSQYNFHNNIVFKPVNKSKEEIVKNMKKLVKTYHSYPFISQRFFSLCKRGFLNFHFILFAIENVFTRRYYLKIYKNQI
jgi:radical SAM superfamily enzyme YgiQ (UPF0313 family)